MIVRTVAPRGGNVPGRIFLLPSPRVANLNWITCNVPEAVLLRMLVCKDENSTGLPNACPYPEHKNNTADMWTCRDFKGKLAQIYIRLNTTNPKSRSCVIAFVEGLNLSKTDELMELLKNTIAWLDIEQEKPYFYIFYYGHPANQLTANDSRHIINGKIKEFFNSYSRDEDACIMAPIRRDSECLIVNHAKKFSFGAA
jgi:hypothetical protein